MKLLNAVLVLILILFTQATAFSKQTVRLSTGEWPPFISESLESNKPIYKDSVPASYLIQSAYKQ